MGNFIDKETIKKLLPHREPMLLIDKLINIVPLKSATAIVKVKKEPIIIPKKTWAGIAVQRPIIVLIISLVPSDDPGSPTAIALAIAEDKYTNASSSAKPSPAMEDAENWHQAENVSELAASEYTDETNGGKSTKIT